jgi:hypothetical protein
MTIITMDRILEIKVCVFVLALKPRINAAIK